MSIRIVEMDTAHLTWINSMLSVLLVFVVGIVGIAVKYWISKTDKKVDEKVDKDMCAREMKHKHTHGSDGEEIKL